MQIQLREKEMTIGKFGIEIEMFNVADRSSLVDLLAGVGINAQIEGYNHTTRNHWKIVGDASINGRYSMELVSPVLEGRDGLNQIDKVCAVLDAVGAKVNRSCGLHVHHDASDFNAASIKKAVMVYKRVEKRVDEMMPPSRRGSSSYYAQSVLDQNPEYLAEDGGGEGRRRYHKINLQSFYRHGTIEFRHHSGTVDAEKIKNWVLFTALIMEKSRGRVVSTKTLKRWVDVKWFLGVTTDRISEEMKSMVAFYTARRASFAR
jgi:hypothetical protein